MVVNAKQSVNSEELLIEGLALIFLGPLAVRIYCEMMINFLRMNQTLTEIKNKR